MKVPRVLLVGVAALPSPDRHGAELTNVVKALAPRFDLDVVACKGVDQPVVERYLRARLLRVPAGAPPGRPGEAVDPHPLPLDQIEAFRRAIRRQLEGDEYDVIHFRDAWSGRPICERKADLASRLVFDVALSPLGEPRAADHNLAEALAESEAFCLERADLVLVPSETARHHLELAGFGDKVAVVPRGVDVDHFDWMPTPPVERPVLLYAGRITPGRRVRLFLEAASLMLRRRDLEVWLVGAVDPSLRGPLDDAVRQLGLQGHLREFGPVDHDDVPRLLAQATLCVAPAAPDETERPLAGPPVKILEYMACRRPVVAPRRSSVAEIIRHGVEGLLFLPGDFQDLAACLRHLLEHPDLAADLAAAGYQTVRERYPASAARRRLLEAYGRLLPFERARPVAGVATAPVDALPAHADTTTSRREHWLPGTLSELVPPADAVDAAHFEAAGSLLEGSASGKMPERK